MTLEFEIDRKPVPQARPRFYVRNNGFKHYVGAYDPAKCKNFKEVIAWHAKLVAREKGIREPVRDPIALKVTFMMGENGKEKFHTKKPDISNMIKAIEDSLNGVIYHDDCQIVEEHLYKKVGGPKIVIQLEVLSA
jgi:Holliday junction resolvase RusA-like endonuclease